MMPEQLSKALICNLFVISIRLPLRQSHTREPSAFMVATTTLLLGRRTSVEVLQNGEHTFSIEVNPAE
jgi:hypothetical protein